MTCNILVPTRQQSPKRIAALLGFAAIGLAAGGPAGAACKHGTFTVVRTDSRFVCYNFCTLEGSGLTTLSRLTFTGIEKQISSLETCRAACARTSGCTSFVWHDFWEKDIPFVICTLYGGSSTANNSDRWDAERTDPIGRSWVACHRRPDDRLWREPDIKVDTDRLQQDIYRPHVPAPGLPKKP